MKKKYIILCLIISIEILIVLFLNKNNIKIQSWMGKAAGVFVFLLPVEILLFLFSRDNKFFKKRKCFTIVFWFIIICYVLGALASI